MKQLKLRYKATCSVCGIRLPPSTLACWDRDAGKAFCLSCSAPAVGPEPVAGTEAVPLGLPTEGLSSEATVLVPPPPPPPAPETPSAIIDLDLDVEERGVAGASARAERARRSAKREDRIRSNHKKLGRLILALSDDPTSTRAWSQGAVGEERVGAVLEASRRRGIEALHDRRIPGSRANIDHIVIAPSGVWVVDTKRYLDGELEKRNVGTRRKPDYRLYVSGRDKSSLVAGARKQVVQVQAALTATPFEGVPVHGALCFVDHKRVPFAKPFTVDDVRVTWRDRLVEPMLISEVITPGPRQLLARHLAHRFKPA
jgi:hypothetical protein